MVMILFSAGLVAGITLVLTWCYIEGGKTDYITIPKPKKP